MATWDDVQENERSQQDKYRALLSTAGTVTIEAFYPELHDPAHPCGWAGEFCNNLSEGPLLPQLLTAPHVLVDLNAWPSQNGLIERYGVNLDFLLKLREEGFVQLAANLPADERFEKCAWLHDVLADPRTIFRSVRTPLYFESLNPNAKGKEEELRDRLTHALQAMPEERLRRLVTLSRVTFPPGRPHELAKVLSIWAGRIVAMGRERGEQLMERLPVQPEEVIPELRRVSLFSHTPIAGGLGGGAPMMSGRLKSYFEDSGGLWRAPAAVEAKFDAVSRFLSNQSLDVVPDDFSNVAYWTEVSQSKTKQDRLLDVLRDKDERKRASAFERALRRKISLSGREYDIADIRNYVDNARQSVARSAKWTEVGVVSVCVGFPLLFTEAGVANSIITGLGAYWGCELFKEGVEKLLERTVPELQVVNYVRRA